MKKIIATYIEKWSDKILEDGEAIKTIQGYRSPSRVYEIVGRMARKEDRDMQYHVSYQYYNDETKEFTYRRIEEQEYTI